ncbi:hypothetical protein JRQ81_004758 [Phrynocephalus forsythii]|uniref:Zinc transporter 10 n=1 Tax=Phrynocephalus forsythii TaxID=171643 RepID=A0A9Q1B6D0_9SAUR|nr:hypothetical protein JRQ81_004758 [Phrynocephalus forsythii]
MGRYTGRSSRLLFMCIISFLLFATEMVVAYIGNSLALASDAFAVLSHLISMIIGFLGVRFSRIRWHMDSTFGFSRADAVGAFGNSVFATALMFSILIEAVKRFLNPQKTEQALYVLIVGIIGLFFNVLNYVIFLDCCYCRGAVDQEVETGAPRPRSATAAPRWWAPSATPSSWPPSPSPSWWRRCSGWRDPKGSETLSSSSVSSLNAGGSVNPHKQNEEEEVQKKEKKSEALNIRGVLLHVMGDALGSVIVVVAAAIFYALPLDKEAPCNWQCYIDPSLTIVMVAIILSSAFPLIKETATILLQMVPKSVNMQILTNKLLDVPGVTSIHEVHVWELVKGKNIATLHLKCPSVPDYEKASYKMREVFHEAGVHSVTIQPEYVDHRNPEILCSAPCISAACNPHLCCSQQEAFLAQVNGYNGKGGLSPTLQKSFKKIDMVAIPAEPTWAEDVIKKDSSSKDTSKETSQPKLVIRSTTRF